MNEGAFNSDYKNFWLKKDYMPVDSVWGYDAAFVIKGGAELQIDDVELEVKSEKKLMCCVDSASFSPKRPIPPLH